MTLRTIFLYEMKMLVRDTRTVLIAVVAPVVLFPLVILVMRFVEESDEARRLERTYTWAAAGPEADLARRLTDRALALEPAREDTVAESLAFEEAAPADPDSALEAGDLDLLVRGLDPEAYRTTLERERGEAAAEGDTSDTGAGEGGALADTVTVPVLRLVYRSNSTTSRSAMEYVRDRLLDVRREGRDSAYRAIAFPVDPDSVLPVEAVNVASAQEEAGALLGLALTPLLLFLMLSGGSIVAADAIAGEKERGTLETLLTTAATRGEIVAAKLLGVVAVGLAVAVVNLLNLLVYVGLGLIELPEILSVSVTPLGLLVLLVLLTPVAVLVAAVLLLLSGYAQSYKEYQIYFFPVFWVFLVPAAAGALPGMELRSAIAVVPVSGVAVAVREVLVGDYDWPFLLLALLSTSAAAWGAVVATARVLSTERLISGGGADEALALGGPALFPRRVLRWFAVMWAVVLVTSLWFGEAMGLRGQVLFNVVGVFLGATLLMLWRYRLPVRRALALTRPHPAVWIAVVVGAPAALVTGVGVGQLAQLVLPVPERMLESFGQYLLTDELPLWQVVFFLAVLPGVCEELAFRGVLLHGLRRRLRGVPLALAVGLVFGLFHVSLFRIVPTAWLGVVLAGVVILSGSIYPAILWHALNNAVALVPSALGWIEADASLPPWSYAAAAVALGVSFWILWAVRRPLPPPPGAPPGPPPTRGRRPAEVAGAG